MTPREPRPAESPDDEQDEQDGQDEQDEQDEQVERHGDERERRRARVFGDVLPEGTSDERGDGWGERESPSDEWLRGQVPPHHG